MAGNFPKRRVTMSRSCKRTPILKDHTSSKVSKRFANKAVRHARHIRNGAFYRRIYESWDIHDYLFYQPSQWELDKWEANHKRWIDPTNEQAIKNRWAKWYFRK